MKMKISRSVDLIFDMAKDEALLSNYNQITPEHFLLAILKFPGLTTNEIEEKGRGDFNLHKSEMQSVMNFIEENSIEHERVTCELGNLNGKRSFKGDTIHRSSTSKTMFYEIESNIKSEGRDTATVIDFFKYLIMVKPTKRLREMLNQNEPANGTGNLVGPQSDDLHLLQKKILTKVHGQNEVVRVFAEGLFNAEMQSKLFPWQKTPRAVFVFAGPPGVGKTFLAESCAQLMGRHYIRFDMSGYAEHHQHEALIGLEKGYKEARAGLLTSEVLKHPESVLIFDEIEKSHLNTIHLFLQILDSGELEDKYTLEKASFRDTIIIFTTNAGKTLYDNHKISKLTGFHSKTIINALENEIDPKTGQPFFPQSICSRLSSGYVLLFNHLALNDLVDIVESQLSDVAAGFKKHYGIEVEFDKLIPYLMILREGSKPDARTIRSQAEKFFSREIYKITSYKGSSKLEEALSGHTKIKFTIDKDILNFSENGIKLFPIPDNPSVLFFTDEAIFAHYEKGVPQVKWIFSQSKEGLATLIEKTEIDIVLIDLRMNDPDERNAGSYIFGVLPSTSRRFDYGRNMLRMINVNFPDIPVYLYKLSKYQDFNQEGGDEEFINDCIKEGGAVGIIYGFLPDTGTRVQQNSFTEFKNKLLNEWKKIYWEKVIKKLSHENKVISFETTPTERAEPKGVIAIKIRNPQLKRALSASDVGAVLDDITRPELTMESVFGAESAKKELNYFIEFIKNPAKFRVNKAKPSKGILLYGPPGTGKTLLAKAFAGETNLAFIHVNATSFVTSFQGSGPENVRKLFQRARNNAPAVIFIDEIDAIGKARSGIHNMQETENTLNALLAEMDGFESFSEKSPLFVIAATNMNLNSPAGISGTLIDPALIRRFSKNIFLDLPDRKVREDYLNFRLLPWKGKGISPNSIRNIADLSSGMSFADIDTLIETALRESVIKGKACNDEALDKAFHEKRHGDAISMNNEALEIAACHEAGHATMHWLLYKKVPSYVTVVARSRYGGYTAPEPENDEQIFLTKKQLLDKVKVALGGKVAEQICYGDDAITTSASDDLDYATDIILKMIGRFGMFSDFTLLAENKLQKDNRSLADSYYSEMTNLANTIIKEQYSLTKELLQKYKNLLDAVIKELIEKGKLTNTELLKVISNLE